MDDGNTYSSQKAGAMSGGGNTRATQDSRVAAVSQLSLVRRPSRRRSQSYRPIIKEFPFYNIALLSILK